VETINKEELYRKLVSKEQIQVVNVLGPEHYNLGSIKGSKKIPLADLDRRINELDKSKEVITYCASYDCPASAQAAEKLGRQGFKVRAYEGGIEEWKEAGFPTE
jgi:rhodanese-related sulfurtransferase